MTETIDSRLQKIIDELLTSGITLDQAIVEFEKKYVGAALRRARKNITQASKALGVHRNTLHNKLRSWDGERS
jgi:DNA-binding NtrC family response regulator